MSKSKDQTENIPPSSSGESTGETAQPSSPLASTDNTQTFMQSTRMLSLNTPQNDKSGSTTPDNTLTTEKARLHAKIAKAALTVLLKANLIKRYEVQSKDPTTGATTVIRVRYEFDMSLWTESLELK
jgi:hypothetical protein